MSSLVARRSVLTIGNAALRRAPLCASTASRFLAPSCRALSTSSAGSGSHDDFAPVVKPARSNVQLKAHVEEVCL